MKNLLNYTSKVNFAHSKTKSLKVGFPKEISEILNAKAGDDIKWKVNLDGDKIVIIVEKIETDDESDE